MPGSCHFLLSKVRETCGTGSRGLGYDHRLLAGSSQPHPQHTRVLHTPSEIGSECAGVTGTDWGSLIVPAEGLLQVGVGKGRLTVQGVPGWTPPVPSVGRCGKVVAGGPGLIGVHRWQKGAHGERRLLDALSLLPLSVGHEWSKVDPCKNSSCQNKNKLSSTEVCISCPIASDCSKLPTPQGSWVYKLTR